MLSHIATCQIFLLADDRQRALGLLSYDLQVQARLQLSTERQRVSPLFADEPELSSLITLTLSLAMTLSNAWQIDDTFEP